MIFALSFYHNILHGQWNKTIKIKLDVFMNKASLECYVFLSLYILRRYSTNGYV